MQYLNDKSTPFLIITKPKLSLNLGKYLAEKCAIWIIFGTYLDDTYVQFELCAQNIVSGDVVDTLYRCVHNVYVAHQAGMPRQQDAHGISRVSTIEGVMYIFVLGKFNLSILWQVGYFFLP